MDWFGKQVERSNPMEEFIRGAIAMGFGIAGLFFLRFWKETHDRLFGFFALAFFILTINRVAITLFRMTSEVPYYLYIIRLLAFLFILYAILDKNVRRS
jgi:hypothetical protein